MKRMKRLSLLLALCLLLAGVPAAWAEDEIVFTAPVDEAVEESAEEALWTEEIAESVAENEAEEAADGAKSREISCSHIIIYGGQIVTYDNDYDRSIRLTVNDGETECPGVVWESSNDSLIEVDEDGCVYWADFGKATVTGTLDGKKYSCEVEVRELRLYHYWEFAGDEEYSRWVWDYTFCMGVGQTVRYRLEEWAYDENGEVISKTDVTDVYPMTARFPEYLKVKPGLVTALKADSSQDDLSSELSCNIDNPTITAHQMIWFNVFTLSPDDYTDCLEIGMDDYSDFGEGITYYLKSNLRTGYFTLDDMFIRASDWIFSRYPPGEMTWKSSDTNIVRFTGKPLGSHPDWDGGLMAYSMIKAEHVGTGKVEISVWHEGRKLAGFKGYIPAPISDAAIVDMKTQTYTGKPLKPRFKLICDGETLVKGRDYKVSCENNRNVGLATVTIQGINHYTGTIWASFKIIPKKVTLSRLTAGKGRLTVTWKKSAGAGYQIQYGLKKSFSGAKTVTITKTATVRKVLKNLRSGRKYYVRIRGYKKVGGKKYYSAWSKAGSVKVK